MTAMKNKLPNPGLEGYRTAHEQNRDGSYKHFVMPADLVPKKCNGSGGLRLIGNRAYVSFGGVNNEPDRVS